MRITVAILILFIGIVGGGAALEIFLAKRERWWPGLILPILTFLYSLLMVFSAATFQSFTTETVVDGVVVATATHAGSLATVLPQMLAVFLTGNIPTLILLAIYFACREKFRKRKQMDRMNIQDLE